MGPAPFWVCAERQTAGRGRGDRCWHSPSGNLHATHLVVLDVSPSVLGQLAFVAVLALHDAVASAAPLLAPRLGVKWPNDLLIDGAKLAGMLLEVRPAPAGGHRIALGIGVNCTLAPRTGLYPTTSLLARGASVPPAMLLSHLTVTMAQRFGQWDIGAGFPDIRHDWLQRCVGLGEPIAVRLPGRERRGRFADLDERGHLLLSTPAGLETIHAGDVFLGSGDGPRA